MSVPTKTSANQAYIDTEIDDNLAIGEYLDGGKNNTRQLS